MQTPVNIGVVGAGAIGIRAALMHLSLPDVRDRVRLAAVCDPVSGRAEAAAERYGVAAFYETYEELLADSRVDAVTLCSPIGLHYEQGTEECLEESMGMLRAAGYGNYWNVEHHSGENEYAEVAIQLASVRDVLERWRLEETKEGT